MTTEIRGKKELELLASKAEAMQTLYHNRQHKVWEKMADMAIGNFENAAKTHGYKVVWPGMRPILIDENGFEVFI